MYSLEMAASPASVVLSWAWTEADRRPTARAAVAGVEVRNDDKRIIAFEKE